jgi:muramoyltetrapeptide carboxypeptidase
MLLEPIKHGDLIYITAPAKAIDAEYVICAQNFLSQLGYEVAVAEHCLGQCNYFSGTDQERILDLQTAIDNENVKAIWCARGGYGAVRIVDQINWANFEKKPKWLIGFSDITVFHSRLNSLAIPSLHATMPLNLNENSQEAKSSLLDALKGNKLKYHLVSSSENKMGKIQGKLIGGNLSILYSLLGTNDSLDYTNKILFIEDVGEQLYNIDRMMYALDKSGVLDQISGLIVGGFTDLKDSALPFGLNYKEIILSHFYKRKIPIVFDFPAGHIDDNRALIFGVQYLLEVSSEEVRLEQV